jgi:hypothetical protein
MQTYVFASLRSPDFKITASSPEEAYQLLVEQEKENGSLWKLHDQYMVNYCIQNGWKSLSISGSPIAYKII